MAVTVPLGMRHRFSVGHSSDRGWWAAHWRKPSDVDWLLGWNGGDGPPGRRRARAETAAAVAALRCRRAT